MYMYLHMSCTVCAHNVTPIVHLHHCDGGWWAQTLTAQRVIVHCLHPRVYLCDGDARAMCSPEMLLYWYQSRACLLFGMCTLPIPHPSWYERTSRAVRDFRANLFHNKCALLCAGTGTSFPENGFTNDQTRCACAMRHHPRDRVCLVLPTTLT
jgi:hypothetical protein